MTLKESIVDHAQAWWLSFSSHDFGGVFGNALTVAGFSALLLTWGMWAGARFVLATNRLTEAARSAQTILSGTPAEAIPFAAQYEEVTTEFQDRRIIGPAWRDWRATLITPVTPNAPIRSTVRPTDYLSLDLLRNCGINPRLHAAMPNLLVGVGLLLTFLGLSVALSAAGGIVGADKAARDIGLRDLLNAASAKFVFSLVGLACSLSYTLLRTNRLQRAEQALDKFLTALEERIPLATAATLQSDTNALLLRSLEVQELFSTELAVNIGGRLDQALDTRLGEHIGPLREAIEQLSGNLGTRSEDTLREMLEHFLSQLRGGSDEAMQRVATTLAELGNAMGEIQGGMADAANRMGDAADNMAKQMGQQAEDAIGRIAQQMESLVSQLRSLAEQSRDAGSEAMERAAGQIAAAGDGFTRAAQGIAAVLAESVGGLTKRMGAEAENATRQMAAELSLATEALRTLAEQNRTAGEDAVKQLTDRIGQAAGAFEQSAAEVARALAGGAGDATERLTAAMEEMKGQFAHLSDEFGGSLRTAGGAVVESSRSGAEALSIAATEAAEALRMGGRDGGESLRVGGADVGRNLDAAGRTISDPVREMAQLLTTFQAEASALATAVANMRDAAATATTPLGRAASDLAQAGSAAHGATEELSRVGRQIAGLTEALTATVSRLGEVERRIADLSGNITGTVQRFDGMDTALASVFVNLQRGLTGFAEQVTRFTQSTNTDMAKAATHLNAAVNGLTETFEEYLPRLVPGGLTNGGKATPPPQRR